MSEKKRRSVREQMESKTKEHYQTRDTGGFGNSVLDLSKQEGVEFFSPQMRKKKYLIDIIPYEIKTDKHPKYKKGDLDYLLQFWVHNNIGPAKDRFVCLLKTYGKPCPICEELDALREQEADESVIKALKPSKRVLYNIIDLENEDKGIQLFTASHFLFEKELLEEAGAGEEFIIFSDTEEGYSIEFRVTEETIGQNTFPKFKSFAFIEREEPYDESIIDDAYSLESLLNIKDYDTMYESLHSISKDVDEDEDEETPRRKRKIVNKDEQEPKRGLKRKSEKECPSNHTFGVDCDDFDECVDCKIWDACSEAQEG